MEEWDIKRITGHLLRSLASFLARLSSIIRGLLSLQASLGGDNIRNCIEFLRPIHQYNILHFTISNIVCAKATKAFETWNNTRPFLMIVFLYNIKLCKIGRWEGEGQLL